HWRGVELGLIKFIQLEKSRVWNWGGVESKEFKNRGIFKGLRGEISNIPIIGTGFWERGVEKGKLKRGRGGGETKLNKLEERSGKHQQN
ncbi:MAG: hypothetical protein C6I01_02415, partial [Epsilonproteobacteria bacterium]|nr:hypothetical protein [Campylobacterota bacterium]